MVLEHAEYGDTDMKMNKFLTVLALAVGCIVSASAGTITIVNGENDVEFSAPPPVVAGFMPASLGGLPSINAFDLAQMRAGIRLVSAPFSPDANDVNVIRNRANIMSELAGGTPLNDRTVNLSATHFLNGSFQMYDGVSTTFPSWKGKVEGSMLGYGHRILIPVAGAGRVSQYWCRISTTSSNYVAGNMFPIGTNSNGAEIQFNQNFIGIDIGPNGILESSVNPSTGLLTRGGDDLLRTSGSPSNPLITYHYFIRLGATLAININSVGGFDPLRVEFSGAGTNLTITAELGMKNELGTFVPVATHKIVAAAAKMTVAKNGNMVRFEMVDGQELNHYRVLYQDFANGPWMNLHSGVLRLLNSPFEVESEGAQRYYRCEYMP